MLVYVEIATPSRRCGMSKEHFPVFLERLKTIVGNERYDQVVQSFPALTS